MKKSGVLLGILLIAITFWGTTARAELAAPEKGRIGAELILWWPTLSGDAKFDTKYIKGTTIDLQDIMGLDETRTDIELGLWTSPIKRLRASVYWFIDKRTGSKILEKSITVAGKTFSAGTKIDSSLELQRWKFLGEVSIIRNDLGRLGVNVGVVYFDAIASVNDTVTGLSGSGRLQVPLPVLGVAADFHIPKLFGLGVFAEGVGFGIRYSDVTASYIDVRGGLNFKTRFVYAQAGYQYLNLLLEGSDEVRVTMNMNGPFVSIGGKF